jgi:putative flippase GtrA
MKRSDIIATLILGEIAAWLLLSVARAFLKPEFYDKIHNLLLIGLPIGFPILCLIFIYVAFFIGKKIIVIRQAAKFVLVGGLNTLVDWGALSFLIFIFRNSLSIDSRDVLLTIFSLTILYYSLFKGISFLLATVNSYAWNKLWTFKRKTTETVGKEFLQFTVITILGFLINVGIASIIFKFISPVGGLNIDQWAIVSAAIATLVSMIWNFLGYKFIVFDVKSKPPIQNERASDL